MISADTNLFVYAADPDAPDHQAARSFLKSCGDDFVVSQLILVELYMLLRNPAVFKRPYSAQEAAGYCQALAASPKWRCVDYDPLVARKLWQWAERTSRGYRGIIDARIGLTLRHHGVTHFATANVKDFDGLGFEKVWNPLVEDSKR
ncbi:MAG: TA system VapC family ribonuclease toxin [Verrucomicrobiales bacterium]